MESPKFCHGSIIGVLGSVTRRGIYDDFVLSVSNSFAAVHRRFDRFPEHNVILPRPCGLPQPFLSFPRLSHVPLPRQPRRNLLLRFLLIFSFFQFSFFSSSFSSLIFLAVPLDGISVLKVSFTL